MIILSQFTLENDYWNNFYFFTCFLFITLDNPHEKQQKSHEYTQKNIWNPVKIISVTRNRVSGLIVFLIVILGVNRKPIIGVTIVDEPKN